MKKVVLSTLISFVFLNSCNFKNHVFTFSDSFKKTKVEEESLSKNVSIMSRIPHSSESLDEENLCASNISFNEIQHSLNPESIHSYSFQNQTFTKKNNLNKTNNEFKESTVELTKITKPSEHNAKAIAEGKKDGDKKWIAALLLCIFVGGLGIHRFYLGYTWQGIVQLLTAGGCGIWSLIDLVRIITKDLKPKNGNYID